MRRSGFSRPQIERKRSIPTPGTGRGVMAQSGEEVRAVPKHERVIDEGYRRWVAMFPCLRCGLEGSSQAAHPNFGRGKGQKADDTDCFPLCADRPGVLGCHTKHDQLIGLKLTERRQREREYIAIMSKIRGAVIESYK